MARKPEPGGKPPRPARDLPPPEAVSPPRIGPRARQRPDERKEGGPDFGREPEQRERAAEEAREAARPPPAKPRR
ncbi:hypothetical protein [Roseomonas sp. HF4]|uniref:hypothetical protein n=1 Tax=Roseomonas sp. HF4 TaxID=2562313 RepID=UPI0010C0FD71|nr:hypothetical protein [Roseomonas sp. HF4]